MTVYFAEVEDIYFSKTKEYFQEVISSYSIGNYRSATVMLYSVAICDILFKLQELKDMYNDNVADSILQEVDKSRNEYDNKPKSRWEKELIESVYKKTKLLDLEAYTNLNHLYDHRNFSAHPALNEDYELIAPSKETTVANIKNVLKDILTKPPIFIKNIIGTLTEDLKGKGNLYENEDAKLALYLNNKYFSKMTESMKFAALKAFWKFCFCLPEDEDCKNNFKINRKVLVILFKDFHREAICYIKENKDSFVVANDIHCKFNLLVFLSEIPLVYDELNVDTQLQVDEMVENDTNAKAIAWFKFKCINEHLEVLKTVVGLKMVPRIVNCMKEHYENIGEMSRLIDFFIWYYGESRSFDSADERFGLVIEPFLDKMSTNQFVELVRVTDANNQIWNRGRAYSANNKVVNYAKDALHGDFDFAQYPNFQFDKEIIQPSGTVDFSEASYNVFDDCPF